MRYRRWNIDTKPTVGISDYATFANNPIRYNDVSGDTLSWNLFNPLVIDWFNDIANAFIKKQTSDGVYAVFTHSSKTALFPSMREELRGPKSVVQYLSNTSKQFSKGMKAEKQITLILYGCHVGEGDNSLAEQISRQYKNITVVAPDGAVYYGNPELPVVGKDVGYITFKEGKKVSKKILAIGTGDKEITQRGKDEPLVEDKAKENNNQGHTQTKGKTKSKKEE